MKDNRQIVPIIEKQEEDRYNAMFKSDTETLDRLMSDRAFFLHSSGTSDTKAQYLETLSSGHLVYENIERTDTEIFTYGDTVAYVRGRVRADIILGEKPISLNNIIVAVWILEDDRWQLASSQSTPLLK